jgi:hypothetical protein
MKRQWKEIPPGDKRAQWAGIYVTMNSKGIVVLNQVAHDRSAAPKAYLLLYDAANNTIGLKPSTPLTRNAFPVGKYGRHGSRRVNAYRVLTENGLHIKDTLEFPDAEVDEDGVLVLNLRTARVSNRALNHPRRKQELRT